MQIRIFQKKCKPRSKILFLGYDEHETCLLKEAALNNCEVWHTKDRVQNLNEFDCIISFGYRHIINKKTIDSSKLPILNLHISYLPWNRGSHPNFWSLYDSTPIGITIHAIDSGIDTGPIAYQKLVVFDDNEKTFHQTHMRLLKEIENLFLEKFDEILDANYRLVPQIGNGSYHHSSELPKEFSGWDSDVKTEIFRLKNKFNLKGIDNL